MEIVASFFEIIGTVAFAVSGAMTAMRKRMDLLGIIVLGIITAVGGGIIRDLILGLTPPAAFREPRNALIATAAAVVMFLPWVRRLFARNRRLFDTMLHVMDTVGLSVFTVLGIRIAMLQNEEYQIFLLIFVGVITGVGGGVLRDVLAGDRPYIFVKHVYACASIAGAAVCVLLWSVIPEGYAMLAGAAVIVVIRVLSSHFEWNLPHAKEDI